MSRLALIRSFAVATLLGTLSACTLLPEAEPIRVFLLPTSASRSAASRISPGRSATVRTEIP